MKPFKNPIIVCDECKHEFKFKRSKLKTEKVAEGIERTFFKCPKCKQKFIVMYKDLECEKNLKEMDKIKIEIEKIINKKEDPKELFAKYEKLYNRNLKISDEYKKVYGR